MINHLLAVGVTFLVGFLVGYVLPKNKDELQSDENVKEANRIINKQVNVKNQ